MNTITIESQWCGQLNYQAGLDLQHSTLLKVQQDPSQGHILGLEHSSVITLGKRAVVEQDLVKSENQLIEQGISVHRVDRGGQATIHSPGQLVIYPIIKIEALGFGVKNFVQSLLETTVDCLQSYQLEARADYDRAGVYIGDSKICFCGIRMVDGVSTHGISINIKNDLDLFRNIRSCGVANSMLTSLDLNKVDVTSDKFFEFWVKRYLKRLKV